MLEQDLGVDRLDEVALEAAVAGARAIPVPAVGRHRNQPYAGNRVVLLNLLRQREAIGVGKADVAEHDMGARLS